MDPFLWAVRSFRKRGFVQTAKVAWSFFEDLFYDWKYGTDTNRRVEMSTLPIESTNRGNAKRYGATKAQPFMKLMRRLEIPSNSVFVDIGSGKGKVLLMAAQCGFERIIGIDFSPELCAIARVNIAAFQKRHLLHSAIEIVECDAISYRFSPEENVFFIFDPFNGKVLKQVLERLRISLKEALRKVWFIYHSPEHHNVIEKSRLFQSCMDFNISGTEFKVYTNDTSK